MPSNRPQTIIGPGPAASSATRDWVNGRPRGLISSLGRSFGRSFCESGTSSAASMAAASTSARSTMPGPPPAGVSSTLRCRSVAESRMSRASSAHSPDASALPARLTPSGPGNISGNSVSTVARQVILETITELIRASYAGLTRISIHLRQIFAKAMDDRIKSGHDDNCAAAPSVSIVLVTRDLVRQFDHHTSVRAIDQRHHGIGERQQHGRALRWRDLDDVAGAKIVDRDDAAERFIRRRYGGEPDQVGVIELILVGGRQFFTRDVKLKPVEALGVLARGDAFQRRHQMALCLAGGRHFERARAVFGQKRPVLLHGKRVFRKRPQLHRAAHPMRGADPRDADACRHRRAPPALTSWLLPLPPSWQL